MKKQQFIPIGIIIFLVMMLILSGVIIYQKKQLAYKQANLAQLEKNSTPNKKNIRKLRKEERKRKKEEERLKKEVEDELAKTEQEQSNKKVTPSYQPQVSARNVSYTYPEASNHTNAPHQRDNDYTSQLQPINPIDRNQAGQANGIGSKLMLSIAADTFSTAGSNLALLNSNHDFDTYLYMQSLIDLSIEVETPKEQTLLPVDFKFTGRLNTIFGNSGEMTTTSEEFVKIGRAVTETLHTHTIDRPLLWAKEAWIKTYTQSERTFFQVGMFPKKIGQGLILGNAYKVGNPALINNDERFIDQYRPGMQMYTISQSGKMAFTGYYGMNVTTSTSIENQASFTNGQELQNNTAPYKRVNPSPKKLQNNYILSAELDFNLHKPTSECDNNHVKLKPFLLFNKDAKQHVEFSGDAESKLWTIGACIDAKKDRFECNLEFGVNFGCQSVKSWDRNVVEEHARLTQTHLFAKTYALIDNPSSAISDAIDASGSWELSPAFPWPSEDNRGLQFDAGVEYRDENPTLVNHDFLMPADETGSAVDMNHVFKNSYSRFRKSYDNSYKGWMFALDMSFKFTDKLKLGITSGLASGDDNPNDSSEKAFLYRLDSNWDTIRQDKTNHDYSGFNGVQSMYTSKNVPSLFILQAHKLNRPLSQGPNITNPVFSNLGYLGIGLHYENKNDDRAIHFNPNFLLFATPHSVKFGYDPTVYDIFTTFLLQEGSANLERFSSHNKTLSSMLGMELNATFNYMAKDALRMYATAGIFIPGSYYDDIKSVSYKNQGQNIPLKNQLKLAKLDVTGDESVDFYNTTLLNSAAWYLNVGIEFNFDTETTLFHRRRKQSHK